MTHQGWPIKNEQGTPLDYIELHTVTGSRGVIRLPIGQNYAYKRAEGAITLVMGVDAVTPITVEFDLNGDGTWTWRKTLLGVGGNQYIHPADDVTSDYYKIYPTLSPLHRPPTEAQRRTLARWCYHPAERPFACGSAPGGPLKTWAGLTIQEAERLGEPATKPYYTD